MLCVCVLSTMLFGRLKRPKKYVLIWPLDANLDCDKEEDGSKPQPRWLPSYAWKEESKRDDRHTLYVDATVEQTQMSNGLGAKYTAATGRTLRQDLQVLGMLCSLYFILFFFFFPFLSWRSPGPGQVGTSSRPWQLGTMKVMACKEQGYEAASVKLEVVVLGKGGRGPPATDSREHGTRGGGGLPLRRPLPLSTSALCAALHSPLWHTADTTFSTEARASTQDLKRLTCCDVCSPIRQFVGHHIRLRTVVSSPGHLLGPALLLLARARRVLFVCFPLCLSAFLSLFLGLSRSIREDLDMGLDRT